MFGRLEMSSLAGTYVAVNSTLSEITSWAVIGAWSRLEARFESSSSTVMTDWQRWTTITYRNDFSQSVELWSKLLENTTALVMSTLFAELLSKSGRSLLSIYCIEIEDLLLCPWVLRMAHWCRFIQSYVAINSLSAFQWSFWQFTCSQDVCCNDLKQWNSLWLL